MAKSKTTGKSDTRGFGKAVAAVQQVSPAAISERRRLLVTVAAPIVASIMQDPSPGMTSSEKMAEVALDIAEQLLQQAGIEPDDTDIT